MQLPDSKNKTIKADLKTTKVYLWVGIIPIIGVFTLLLATISSARLIGNAPTKEYESKAKNYLFITLGLLILQLLVLVLIVSQLLHSNSGEPTFY